MTKAIKSLSISDEAEATLTTFAKQLQEGHVNDKMLYNFKVRQLYDGPVPRELVMDDTTLVDVDGNFFASDNLLVEAGNKVMVQHYGNNVEGVCKNLIPFIFSTVVITMLSFDSLGIWLQFFHDYVNRTSMYMCTRTLFV